MDNDPSNSIQVVINHCQILDGRGNEPPPVYKNKVRDYLLLYSKAVFGVFQRKAQPQLMLSINDTATLNVVASEHRNRRSSIS